MSGDLDFSSLGFGFRVQSSGRFGFWGSVAHKLVTPGCCRVSEFGVFRRVVTVGSSGFGFPYE